MTAAPVSDHDCGSTAMYTPMPRMRNGARGVLVDATKLLMGRLTFAWGSGPKIGRSGARKAVASVVLRGSVLLFQL